MPFQATTPPRRPQGRRMRSGHRAWQTLAALIVVGAVAATAGWLAGRTDTGGGPDGPPPAALRTAAADSGSVQVTPPGAASGAAGVPPQTPAPAVPPVDTADESMPRGDLPGWRQVFSDDFTEDLAPGQFPGPYEGRWSTYDGFQDTRKTGWYDDDILSVQNGALRMDLHTGADGRRLTAALVPLLDGEWGGTTFGRYSIRFRADPIPGYGAAWLLWPDSDRWDDGEIDFPEGEFNSGIKAYNHCPGRAAFHCGTFDTGVGFDDWHVATTTWTSTEVVFQLDGVVIGRVTDNITQVPMHWVLQTETWVYPPGPEVRGSVYIDWVSVWEQA
ncbi:glycoside hydrolase family 16 protein [Nakamurella leprariae]|uniref:Family 16 glycosylhydrolase n=1 Tax=Nakamurella leprariae TaxID=2803911 RepID=A0A938YGC3_9ACTN|nr:glycoside hydrolase family 16 protein [Nakamurella leprariae]MBM9467872.1 family 16 glycosylhydrolase [Nakamurella leprariae]